MQKPIIKINRQTIYTMQTGTAVPANVNLSRQKPYAVSAYSRRVKSLANNAQAFGPDSYVNITLDTSTPGSFLDPLQSYLKFDLTFINTNPFADYVSFGPAGAASLIEEFRIYVQGTPIEEILQYNVFYELAMNQNGQVQQPFSLFRPSTLTQGVGDLFHTAAIKPPMVDLDGAPMFGGVQSDDPRISSSRAVAWGYTELDANDTDFYLDAQVIASNAPTHQKMCFSGCRPYFNTAIAANTQPMIIADAHALLGGASGPNPLTVSADTSFSGSMTNIGIGRSPSPAVIANPATGNLLQTGVTLLDDGDVGEYLVTSGQVLGDMYQGRYTVGLISNQMTNYLSPSDAILPFAGSTVEVPSLTGIRNGNNIDANAYNPDNDPRNPLNWSSFVPPSFIRPEMKTLGPDNLQDYFMFLANTKNIPVGMPGQNNRDARSYASTSTNSNYTSFNSVNFRNLIPYDAVNNAQRWTYTCCIPLISGVLGSFADKCWPTMLVAPGSMYIQIRTAAASKAFQVSMDPCRRVLGTIRDYLPFGGSIGGVFGQFGFTAADVTGAPPGNQSRVFSSYNAQAPGLGQARGFLPRETQLDYKPPEAFYQISTNAGIAAVKNPNKICSYLNGYACIGSTLAPANKYMTSKYLLGQQNFATIGPGLMFRPYSVAAMQGQWTIGKAYVQQLTGTSTASYLTASEEGAAILPTPDGLGIPVAGTNLGPRASLGSLNAAVGTGGRNALPTSFASTPYVAAYPDLADYTGTAANAVVQADVTVDFSPAGVPLPQYILHSRPWEKKEFFVHYEDNRWNFNGAVQSDIAYEGAACYGSHLLQSIPQSRRVLTHQSPGTLTYQLQNIEFVSQQIILPDAVSASILEDAAAGDISITCNSLHNYQTPIAQSTSQNLIIPAKIASANTMYCLFVPQAYVSGTEAFLYNSLRGICPFGSVGVSNGGLNINGLTSNYDPATSVLGYDAGAVAVNNIPSRSGTFQVQLKVGNELIPQQPLTTITELVTENVKAQHKLFDTSSNVNATYSLSTTESYVMGGASVQGLAYDVVRSGNFTTTFLSAAFCDDQTAINSPIMTYAYACEANYNRFNNRASKGPAEYTIGRLPHGFGIYTPPESTFVIAFDMDTWSRVSDVARSGKYLGNNTITLTLQNALALGRSNADTGSNGYTLQTFVVHDTRFSFQAGGSVVSYY